MTLEYLLIDDHGVRHEFFQNKVRIPGKLEFTVVSDPARLAEADEEVRQFDGAIVDFHLNTSISPRYQPLMYSNPVLLDKPVEVRTGIGVMLHLNKIAPDLPVYGTTELPSRHSEMFLCATSVWLGAEPLNADESVDVLREVLLDPNGEYAHLQAAHARMKAAAGPFADLMDSCLGRKGLTEAYDWLRCLRVYSDRKPHIALEGAIKQIFGIKRRVDLYRTYIPLMAYWQRVLDRFVTAWGGNTAHWPTVEENPKRDLWKEYNPVLEYVRRTELDLFFTSSDVRAALTEYRHKTEKESSW